MNSLSLRVSSIKTSENLKKNSEIRVQLLVLPEKYFPSDCEALPHIKQFQNDFAHAINIEEQLVCVRKCLTCINSDITIEEVTKIIQAFLNLFFIAPLKHPVRNAIAKILQKLQIYHGLIGICLANTIEENIGQLNLNPTIDNSNEFINSIGGCFENFPIAVMAIKMCLFDIFTVINTSIDRYLIELEKPNSPAKKSEIYIFVHIAVRLALSCVHQCFEQTSITSVSNVLEKINAHCSKLIEANDVPMDTKLNCGIFHLLHAKLLDEIDVVYSEIMEHKLSENSIRNLCICFGIINTIDEYNLDENQGFSVLNQVVSDLIAIAADYSIEQNVLVGVCRGLVQLSKTLFLLKLPNHLCEEDEIQLKDLSDKCLTFVWTHAEHYMDSIRHLSKDLFKNVLKLSKKHSNSLEFLTQKSIAIINIGTTAATESVQCLALDYLCQIYGTEFCLLHIPNVNEMLMVHLMSPNWSACYEKLLTSYKAPIHLDQWYQQWVQPILYYRQSNENLQIIENLIGRSIKAQPDIVKYIIDEKSKLPIETYLFVMLTVRKTGLKNIPNWTPANDSIICNAKVHSNDETRIMCLRIIVEVYKTTEPFTAGELKEILSFLWYNTNCQCPSMRQQIVAFMTKAFQRIEASYAIAIKHADTPTVNNYIEFLMKLKSLCVENIFDGANFSRRSISLNLLLQTIKILSRIQHTKPKLIWTEDCLQTLLVTLSDTYEANKILANDIVKYCPTNLVPSIIDFKDEIKKLATSVKPNDSQTAAYKLEYCCIVGWYFESRLDAVLWCEELLRIGLEMAKESLLKAARCNPLYGLVFCIKHLLAKVDMKRCEFKEWRPFCQRFLVLSKELLKVVGPIVNSSSPEGHLPNDFSELNYFLPEECSDDGAAATNPNKILSPTNNMDNDQSLKTTPQMVLLCAWRTVKEVSLLLGDITLEAPIIHADSDGLITIEEILGIGNLFQEMLAETKHRGAFEQAYVGFSKLCVRLWRSNEPALHSCPMQWLHGLIDLISGHEESSSDTLKYDKICATRRSAGVPFMIQALITSELQVCSSTGLHYCMRHLIDLCKTSQNPEPRTHALNILRALFRCTDLGDAVGEYISDGIECSINGYTAVTWPERNSSTLLFSALMTRIFGVQRTKNSDNLNIRNKMTGRIFFLRYPRLYDFFYNQLKIASDFIAKNERPTVLHPLLLLLSRLYPSSLEGCESNLQLTAFLPLILQCSISPELETRKLAVKSIVALIPPHKITEQISSMLKLFKENLNSNSIHGYLLQINYLVRSLSQKHIDCDKDKYSIILGKILKLKILIGGNFVLIKVYADILNELFLRFPIGSFTHSLPTDINNSLNQILFENTNANAIGFPTAVKSCVLLKLLISLHFYPKHIEQLDQEFLLYRTSLTNLPFEYCETILDIILLIVTNTNDSNHIEDDTDCGELEKHFLNVLSKSQIETISLNLQTSIQLRSELNKIVLMNQFYPFITIKAYTILSKLNVMMVNQTTEYLLELIKEADPKTDNLKNAMYKLISVYLNQSTTINWDDAFMDKLFESLKKISEPDNLDNLRYTASKCICNISESLLSTPELLISYSDILLLLLRDDNYYIRENVSKHVMELTQNCETLPPIASRAEELFLNWLNEKFHQFNTAKAAFYWKLLISMQLTDATASASPSEGIEIFNKNEANMYGERLHVCRIAFKLMKSCLNEKIKSDFDFEFGHLMNCTMFCL